MGQCALRCVDRAGHPREVSPNAQFEICEHCRAAIGRDSRLSGAELEIRQTRTAAKARQFEQIRGKSGDGPPPGGYVAQLLQKRRARERDKKKRPTRAPAKHFPRVAAH